MKALSEEQLAQLLDAIEAEDAHWRPFFEFLAQTGLRIGEAIELRWKDVDLGKRTVTVSRAYYRGRAGERVGAPKSKNGKRSVRLTAGMAQRLGAMHQLGEDPDGLVWRSEAGRRVDQSNMMSRVLKPAARSVGVGWASFHTFRHTCGTILFRHGYNAKQVQAWLGHHSAAFTLEVYIHLRQTRDGSHRA